MSPISFCGGGFKGGGGGGGEGQATLSSCSVAYLSGIFRTSRLLLKLPGIWSEEHFAFEDHYPIPGLARSASFRNWTFFKCLTKF